MSFALSFRLPRTPRTCIMRSTRSDSLRPRCPRRHRPRKEEWRGVSNDPPPPVSTMTEYEQLQLFPDVPDDGWISCVRAGSMLIPKDWNRRARPDEQLPNPCCV